MNKEAVPTDDGLLAELDAAYVLWKKVRDHVHSLYPAAVDEWTYSGKKFGWSFRVKDKKRVIVYLLPRKGYFKVAVVFGQKATDAILNSTIAAEIREQLQAAPVYAEGRGTRIDIRDERLLGDIFEMIAVKLAG